MSDCYSVLGAELFREKGNQAELFALRKFHSEPAPGPEGEAAEAPAFH